MILPLRRVHRSAFVALAILLPALLASAWKVRRAAVHQELPPEYLPGSSEARFAGYAYDLVYWAAPLESDELPEDAELVGTVHSGALALQPPAGKRVLVYSLAHHRIHDASRDLAEGLR